MGRLVICENKQGRVSNLFKDLTIELESLFSKYYKLTSIHWDESEPAFLYSEQRTKTFFTIALSTLSNGLLMQEVHTERQGGKRGRIDYYFHCNGLNFLLEIKQKWVSAKLTPPNFSRVIGEAHEEAIAQVQSIKSCKRKYDYALAATFIPLYYRHKKLLADEAEVLEVHQNIMQSKSVSVFKKQILDGVRVNEVAIIPFKDLDRRVFDTGSCGYQSYPFALMALTILKKRK